MRLRCIQNGHVPKKFELFPKIQPPLSKPSHGLSWERAQEISVLETVLGGGVRKRGRVTKHVKNPETFGRTADGHAAVLYTLSNESMRVRITDFGGRIVSVEVADRSGKPDHVVLGFDDVAEYESAGGSFGALLGRTANRISGGAFTLDGHIYPLSKNEEHATLHGGRQGFDKLFWRVDEAGDTHLLLALVSPDGDQGFPGELSVRARYSLADDTLRLSLKATTSKPTPVSLSAHPYFNLAGVSAGDIFGHEITIAADAFLPTDRQQIPTGEIRPVDGTLFDLRQPTAIGTRIRRVDQQLLFGKGYDHYFVLGEATGDRLRLAARVHEPQSGRALEVLTTQPGTQFYTGNNLTGAVAGRGRVYRQSAGLALEPQGFPDAPNRPQFPSTVLRPGTVYGQVIAYRFTTD